MRSTIINKLKAALAPLSKYWVLAFYIISITYLELIFSLWTFKALSWDFAFAALFSLSAGSVLFILSSILPSKINKIVTASLLSLLIIAYGIQLIYYDVFKTPMSFYSLTGTGDVLQFRDIIVTAVLKNIVAVILLFVPLLILPFVIRKASIIRLRLKAFCFILLFFVLSHAYSIICINFTKESSFSQYTLYYKSYVPELSIKKLGLMTTMRLDIKKLVFGSDSSDNSPVSTDMDDEVSVTNIVYKIDETPMPSIEVAPTGIAPTPEPNYEANILDIDFNSIISKEKNKTLLDMHKYFSTVEPTKKNKYTGVFKGYNLILLTAEGFSPYAISRELTPTLYKMSTESFVFNNFYNPVWRVSTSDGEFVACTGLIPKPGIWSFSRTGKNYMPFVMGNQFKDLGYTLKAYHNHSYKYYDRHISHPNMGYDYKGVGNGLNIKKTWPESDLEMIDVTAGEYIGDKPFHTYYMTVSGHLNYSFGGNYIARKNKSHVEDLPYSDTAKAYIACNMELEFAMKSLVEKLEATGIADKTVIAISADHYPYGLPKENIDELSGHKVEDNFELYKSTFILWKKGMDTVIIDKPCSSLDIIPTLSNLFGLDYDSRLLMGTDILSDADPLVIFSNRSWITDKARFNTASNSIEYTNGSKADSNYIKAVNRVVSDKFKYSAKIIETDYYGKIK
ncbi:MAG TPA: sulfatase-like hydrolase/transferase [Pseudobacteroides sp.]|uniref:LTA synthase family protein n=1 Tax=Pseudobacteroides sp. TaxID=1968840 RepID=UPI002F93C42E